MRKILIIGMGAGDPDYVTVQAINALNATDVVFIPDKGAEKAALRQLRDDLCKRYIKQPATVRTVEFKTPKRAADGESYQTNVADWHLKLEAAYESLFEKELADGECGAFLTWGDPTLYDSTLRILERIRAKGFALEYDVIPGISAVQALAARHRIGLNRIGGPVLITTGRKLGQGFPEHVEDVVVMLDGDQAFAKFASDDVDIYWGAYLGTDYEILVSGKLSEVAGDIERLRRQARAERGWIMDTYLLRKGAED